MISGADAALLAGAGALAGLAGTAGGITSLISYPALLLAGVPPLPANVANVVALVACWPGSAVASRPELRGRGAWLARWAPVAAAGGATGAVLLVSTPPGVFARVVPFLLAAAALALLLQPRLSAWLDRRQRRAGALVLAAGLFAVSAYNGYFGAGAGVMLLALMLLTTDQHLARANALKNMLLGPGVGGGRDHVHPARAGRLGRGGPAGGGHAGGQRGRAADHPADAARPAALAGRADRAGRGRPPVGRARALAPARSWSVSWPAGDQRAGRCRPGRYPSPESG